MTIRLKPYEHWPTEDPSIVEGGFLDYKSRIPDVEAVQSAGIAARHAGPESEKWELPLVYMLDIHRRIPEYLGRSDQTAAVLDFASQYGDWFTSNVTGQNFRLRKPGEWLADWNEIKEVLELSPKVIAFQEKLHEHGTQLEAEFPSKNNDITERIREAAGLTIRDLYMVSNSRFEAKLSAHTNVSFIPQKKPGTLKHAYQADGMVGWCWALLANDYYSQVTYKPCQNCDRELPSVSPITRKTTLTWCSEKCRNQNKYKKGVSQ